MPKLTIGSRVVATRGKTLDRPGYGTAPVPPGQSIRGVKFTVVSQPEVRKDENGVEREHVCIAQEGEEGPGVPLYVPTDAVRERGTSGKRSFSGMSFGERRSTRGGDELLEEHTSYRRGKKIVRRRYASGRRTRQVLSA